MMKLFICYRRGQEEAAHYAIWQRLCHHFGQDSVFQDIDRMPVAVDFREVLSDQVRGCDVVLAMISKNWLTATGEAGRRRLDLDNDFVRYEIETALGHEIPIIPILIDEAEMPKAGDLPSSIRELAYRHGVRVRVNIHDFDTDTAVLRRQLEGLAKAFAAVKAEQEHFRSACDSGDWVSAHDRLKAAIDRDDLRKTPGYRALVLTMKTVAEPLKAAEEESQRSDFKAALASLEKASGTAAPPSVAAAMALARLGVRLTELRATDLSEIRAAGQEIGALLDHGVAGHRKVPFERQVRDLLQRMLKDAEHQEALQLYEAASFAQTATAFEALGDYKDAKERFGHCSAWLGAFRAIRDHNWETARALLRPLTAREDEFRARSVQRWCVLARQFVPILQGLATAGTAAEVHIPWEDGRSPYAVLGVGPSASIPECNELSYEFQRKAGGMTAEQRASWDALRLVDKRLLVDFNLYTVRDPARVRGVLTRYFAFEETATPAAMLERIGQVVQEASMGSRPFYEQLAAELGDDAGVLSAVGGNYDAAIDRFLEQVRSAPYDFLALHHLGLAACAKAHLDDSGDWWEFVCLAWGAVFADTRFWRAWWAQRLKIYPVTDEETVQSARLQLQRYWTEELKTVGKGREVAEAFRIELSAARSVAAQGGIPVGPGPHQRATLGPRAVAALGLTPHLATWIRTFPEDSLTHDGSGYKICVAFSTLAPAQALYDGGRHQEAIELLSAPPPAVAAEFVDANPGFANVAGDRGPVLFLAARSALLRDLRMKLALTAVSEVPVDIDRAVAQWQEALSVARALGAADATVSEIREVLIGRCDVLRAQQGDGRLEGLNDAVKLLQEGIDQGWDGADGVLRQALVDALLDRGIHLSNVYDLEKEARQDAQRAWGMAPNSLRAVVVLCTASLHYARDLYRRDERKLSEALVREVENRLTEGEKLFPGNADLQSATKAAAEMRALLGADAPTALEHALNELRATAKEAKAEEGDSRLAQAMVREAQSDFPRAIELYWALVQQNPGDQGLRGKMCWCYRLWINHLLEQKREHEYRAVVKAARERCAGSMLLVDIVGAMGEEGQG